MNEDKELYFWKILDCKPWETFIDTDNIQNLVDSVLKIDIWFNEKLKIIDNLRDNLLKEKINRFWHTEYDNRIIANLDLELNLLLDSFSEFITYYETKVLTGVNIQKINVEICLIKSTIDRFSGKTGARIYASAHEKKLDKIKERFENIRKKFKNV